ncbi:MAG TPA: hypothetical protein VMU48_17700 [Terracidiphilus sp.]|nr:hypothetical protein [Terracidiphilus sp.]
MKISTLLVPLVLLVSVVGLAQNKSTKRAGIPAVFQTAHSVYVEADSGDTTRPGMYAEDREAISNVESGLQEWNRYTIAPRRDQADLIVVVRKGRFAGEQVHDGLSVGTRPMIPGSARPAPMGSGEEVGSEGEVDQKDDLLMVYMVSSDGDLTGPIWRREMVKGLDAPKVELLRQLRKSVDRAYPMQASGKNSVP